MLASLFRLFLPWGISVLLYGLTALPGNAELLTSDLPAAGTTVSADFGAAVPMDQLENARGGTFETRSHMTLTGSTNGNSAEGVVSGNNVIEAGSFDQMSGLPVVVQNSGSNVLIQNAVIVNMQMQ